MTRFADLPQVQLDRRSRTSLQRQLYAQIRALILGGDLAPGTRLPPTRALAASLDISRNTVTFAYQRLEAEGLLTARVGAGTRVNPALPKQPRRAKPPPRPARVPVHLSRRGTRLAEAELSPTLYRDTPGAFRPGGIAVEHFPFADWGRLVGRVARRGGRELVSYGDPSGYLPLRRLLVDYLRRSRAVRCDVEQVIITSGSQHALDLTARLLIEVGDVVGIEDPSYLGARAALSGSRPDLRPLPVDDEGLRPEHLEVHDEKLRLIYTTPSHQYPLGVTMSATRRLALLEHARRYGAWVVEDDYDSEFRYDTHPLPALQSLDEAGQVIYIGTFSKVLSPALRLGYLVVPENLIEPFRRARAATDHHPPMLAQLAVAAFMDDGHLDIHLRRMRGVYRARRDALREAVQRELAGVLELGPSDAGIHVTAWLPHGTSDDAVSREAGQRGIDAPPLSHHYAATPPRGGLVLGYGAADEDAIADGVTILAAAIQRVSATSRAG